MVPLIKADLNILSKSAAVVIASGFGISDGLQRSHKRYAKPGKLAWFLGGVCACAALSPLPYKAPLRCRDDNEQS